MSNLEQQVRILLLTKLFQNFIPEGTDDAGPTLGCVNPPRTVRDPAIDIMAGATFERHLLSLRPGPPVSGRQRGKVKGETESASKMDPATKYGKENLTQT